MARDVARDVARILINIIKSITTLMMDLITASYSVYVRTGALRCGIPLN